MLIFQGCSDLKLASKVQDILLRVSNGKIYGEYNYFDDPNSYYIFQYPPFPSVVRLSKAELDFWIDKDAFFNSYSIILESDLRKWVDSHYKFNIYTEVIVKNSGKVGKIIEINMDQDGQIYFRLDGSSIPGSASYTSDDLDLHEETIVGWKCEYCGMILRSKKPHICKGHYRCKKLNFSPIKMDSNTIELPKGFTVDRIDGNTIHLINNEEKEE